jgi:hypothetical protein
LFCVGFSRDRVSQTICPSWLQTVILLVSAHQVARITGVSHWRLACIQRISKKHFLRNWAW